MSNISDVYDTLLTAIAALFPNKTRIPNAESLPDNPSNFMRNGWALRVDSQSPEPSEFHMMETANVFTVILTEEILKTDSQTSQIDTARKSLLEDVLLVQKDFFNVDQLGIPQNIARVELGGRSAIGDVRTGKSNFVFVEVFFNFYIREIL